MDSVRLPMTVGESERGNELLDDDLDAVVGGLTRAWIQPVPEENQPESQRSPLDSPRFVPEAPLKAGSSWPA